MSYKNLFTYLREFSKLRSSVVFDIDTNANQYPEKIWLSEIPNENCQKNIFMPGFQHNVDYWLKIEKTTEPKRPIFPELPGNLELWVDKSGVDNIEPNLILKNKIFQEGKEIQIEYHQNIKEEFNEYLKIRWEADIINYASSKLAYEDDLRKHKNNNTLYNQLFNIHNKVSHYPEVFELVIGVGLLNFRENTDRPRFFRHLLTQRMEIEFNNDNDTDQPYFIIRPNLDQPPIIEQELAALAFTNLLNNPVQEYINTQGGNSTALIDSEHALRWLINQSHPDGNYESLMGKPDRTLINNTPYATFSPALILRRKNLRSLSDRYNRIIEELENHPDEPNISIMEDMIGLGPIPSSGESQPTEFNPLLFPKEYNEEQKNILNRLNNSNKVLVQGPPGTGKSHTISNIICHLLAYNKKILVTAYTKRALEVLKEKLPEDFKALTVNYWGSDGNARNDLHNSINSLNQGLSNIDPEELHQAIDSQLNQLQQIREKISYSTNQLASIRRNEPESNEFNESYSGTLVEIAKKLSENAENFAWYQDSFCQIPNHDFIDKVQRYITQRIEFLGYSNLHELKFNIPEPESLVDIEIIREYSNLIASSDLQNEHDHIVCQDLEKLIDNLKKLKNLYNEIQNLQIDSLIDTKFIGSDQITALSLKKEKSEIIINRLDSLDLQSLYNNIEISYPKGIGFAQIRQDASILLSYLKKGSSLSGFSFRIKKPFLPSEIKERLYFLNEIKVNGSPCDTIEEFEAFLQFISVHQDFKTLSEIWEEEIKVENLQLRLEGFKQIHNRILRFLEIGKKVLEIKKFINSISNIQIKLFDSKKLKLNLIAVYRELIQQSKNYLASDNIHPIKEKIIHLYENPNHQEYQILFEKIRNLTELKSKFTEFNSLKEELNSLIPQTLADIENNSFSLNDIESDTGLKQAILYKHASILFQKSLEENNEEYLTKRIKQLKNDEKQLIGKIASQKAWLNTINNITNQESLTSHLAAWQYFVNKIPQTANSPNYRHYTELARKELQRCKEAIPCWIMPLDQVVEQFEPKPGMFDVVIIDEASQLGIDAILLYYLAKKVIVVGDDKQTAPESIGIRDDIVHNLITTHLRSNNIPFYGVYTRTTSFFDHCKIFAQHPLMLQEHFRCMPEIIHFSNSNFYNGELYPLRQYDEKRLTPLKTYFCENGFIESNEQTIRNVPEANQIVDTIFQLIQDENYATKSIGVISLQGNAQASLIQNKLLNKIGIAKYQKHKIICGNAASLQGDERDIIFLSLVTAHNHNRNALIGINYQRRYNVAVSRARDQIWLFHSVQLEDLNHKDLRYKILDHFLNFKLNQLVLNRPIIHNLGSPPSPFDSWFEVEIYNDIVNYSNVLSIVPQYKVARYRIDLVIMLPNGSKLAIECDGDRFHGPEHFERDMNRQITLERVGWVFFRIRASEYYFEKQRVLQPLWELIERMQS